MHNPTLLWIGSDRKRKIIRKYEAVEEEKT